MASSPNQESSATTAPSPEKKLGPLRRLISGVQARILSGLIAALPIALTFFIIHWLYVTLMQVVLTPVIEVVRYTLGNHGMTETFWYKYFAPVIAIGLVLLSLYALGMFVQLRLIGAVNWLMLRVPIVNTIFKAVSNVFQSLGQQLQGSQGFKRIVLVEFPHPGIKSLAFVTKSLQDASTGRTILCVCVLTGVMPPSGFTLFVPEENVTDVDWSANQTLQAILSGGITTPASIHYFEGVSAPPSGPITDSHGHPIA